MTQSGSGTDPFDEEGPEAQELANPQPQIARYNNETPRAENDAEQLYPAHQGEPPDSVEQSESIGEQVVAENRERRTEK